MHLLFGLAVAAVALLLWVRGNPLPPIVGSLFVAYFFAMFPARAELALVALPVLWAPVIIRATASRAA